MRVDDAFVEAPLIRRPVESTKQNGLDAASHILIDKITAVTRSKLQKRLGTLPSASSRTDDAKSISMARAREDR